MRDRPGPARGVIALLDALRRATPLLLDSVVEGGASCVCSPSYVVTMRRALAAERPTCFRTPQPAVVHL